jgi:alkanesulfonate monooxygenase SsuD/methylene tetrahydromethanopterin reductase-like flavin-dependent oxidoreductase (luciferase family)
VSFKGRWHAITEAGINPLPVQRPIPIWIGGYTEVTLRRVAKLGDGYFPRGAPDAEAAALVERLRGYAAELGRDPSTIGIDARIEVGRGTPDQWRALADGWRALGATHLSLVTMGAKLPNPAAHVAALERAAEALLES